MKERARYTEMHRQRTTNNNSLKQTAQICMRYKL